MGGTFLLRKLGGALVTLVAIAVLNFVLFRLLPGDPITKLLPRNVSAAQKDALRARLGLDQPILPAVVRTPSGDIAIDLSTLPDSLVHNQFVTSMGNLATFDLGLSFAERKPVSDVILDHLWPTVLLVGTDEVSALAIGLAIGIRAGWKRGSRFDSLSINGSIVLYAVPLFWLGMLLFYFFATPNGVPLFPGQQMVTPGARYADPVAYWVDVLRHLVLPATTLALGLIAGNALIMRSSMVETLKEDYVTTARAKGLSESQVV
ncbi:MAG: ABC transporter permease, partial [Chloroflexota bacterium]